jgi:hypothetical protein
VVFAVLREAAGIPLFHAESPVPASGACGKLTKIVVYMAVLHESEHASAFFMPRRERKYE